MTTKINDFITQIKTTGLARTNRFAVEMSPPSISNPNNIKTMLLFCDQANLPGANYVTTPSRTYGEVRELPYDKTFDNLSMTFYVDRGMHVKQIFDEWQAQIQDPYTRSFNYYDKYISDIVITVQDINDKTQYKMKLFECYPKTITGINLDNQSKDVMKLQVTFQYRYWIASPAQELADGQIITTSLIDKFTENFTGFQERFQKGLGTLQNFATGAVVMGAQKQMQQWATKIRF